MGLLDLLGFQVALRLGLREFGAMANGPDDRTGQQNDRDHQQNRTSPDKIESRKLISTKLRIGL